MSIMHVNHAYQSCMSIMNVDHACQSGMSIMNVNQACQSGMPIRHAGMSTGHVNLKFKTFIEQIPKFAAMHKLFKYRIICVFSCCLSACAVYILKLRLYCPNIDCMCPSDPSLFGSAREPESGGTSHAQQSAGKHFSRTPMLLVTRLVFS